MSLVSFLKKLPVDLGQAERKHDSAGKKIALSFLRSGEGKTALDIGCRDGYFSELLKAKGYRTNALDISPEYPNALKWDVEKGLPFGDRAFDLVWCSEVLEHLRSPQNLLAEIDRVLKPGGRVILTTPNSACWFYFLFRLWGWTPQKIQNPDHKQFFSERGIRKLAPGYRVFGYFPYTFVFWRISRLVGLLSPTFVLLKQNEN